MFDLLAVDPYLRRCRQGPARRDQAAFAVASRQGAASRGRCDGPEVVS